MGKWRRSWRVIIISIFGGAIAGHGRDRKRESTIRIADYLRQRAELAPIWLSELEHGRHPDLSQLNRIDDDHEGAD